MTDCGVASQTVVRWISSRAVAGDFSGYVFVTANTVFLNQAGISRLDANGLVEILQRETLGMPEAVVRLGQIFPHKVVGDVAIVASGKRMVACFLPCIVRFAHDMAIHTRFGIAAEIRPALAVRKSKTSQADNHSDAGGQQEPHHSRTKAQTHFVIVMVQRAEKRASRADSENDRVGHRVQPRLPPSK
jgi:hypothetical protein